MKKLFFIMCLFASVGANADTFPRYTNKEKEVINYCKGLDVKALESVRSGMVGSGVLNTIGTLADGASVATSMTSMFVDPKNTGKVGDGKDAVSTKQTVQGLNIASAVTSGIATATSISSTAVSGTSLSQFTKLLDDIKNCVDGLDSLSSAPTTVEVTTTVVADTTTTPTTTTTTDTKVASESSESK